MAPIRIVSEESLRVAAAAAVDAHRTEIAALLPRAEIEHVGSTSIPGALTKGDVDLLVRVEAEAFAAAVAALRGRYTIHQRENWSATYASFVDPDATAPPVGVQLAVRGSSEDRFFGPFREALMADPSLLAQYNALKLAHDGDSYDRYTDAKGAFVEQVLANRETATRRYRWW